MATREIIILEFKSPQLHVIDLSHTIPQVINFSIWSFIFSFAAGNIDTPDTSQCTRHRKPESSLAAPYRSAWVPSAPFRLFLDASVVSELITLSWWLKRKAVIALGKCTIKSPCCESTPFTASRDPHRDLLVFKDTAVTCEFQRNYKVRLEQGAHGSA